MNFPRQWFPPHYSVGLSTHAIAFERALLSQNYAEAAWILSLKRSDLSSYWQRQQKRLSRLEGRARSARVRSSSLRISFSGFWPDMDPTNCQLLDLIMAASPGVRVEPVGLSDSPDIAIYSCYGDNPCTFQFTEDCDRWLFLGENVRPEYFNYDFSLSFDPSEYGGRNTYLPLWMLEIDWFRKCYPDRIPITLNSFTRPRMVDYSNRSDALVYIGNNSEPMREFILGQLERLGIPVERYGSQSRPVANKQKLLESYKLTLAFENSYYPGYMTEKLLHAHAAGTACLYWGGGDSMTPITPSENFVYSYSSIENIDRMFEFIQSVFRKRGPIQIAPLIEATYLYAAFGSVLSAIRARLKAYI